MIIFLKTVDKSENLWYYFNNDYDEDRRYESFQKATGRCEAAADIP